MTRNNLHEILFDPPRQFHIHVEVTEKDIELARPHHSVKTSLAGHCPIAFALNRSYPEVGVWHVGNKSAMALHGRKVIEFPLPMEAQCYILYYDAFANAEPFSFHIDPLQPIQDASAL